MSDCDVQKMDEVIEGSLHEQAMWQAEAEEYERLLAEAEQAEMLQREEDNKRWVEENGLYGHGK